MPKRANHWTEDKIARYCAEGQGSGKLTDYKPWLTIQNIPSSGRVHQIKGWCRMEIKFFTYKKVVTGQKILY
ncbi:hypothetical protein [Sporolactobacillus pectinivorans]|uniref:hypothetical protein n=1 Tax=Sporolactobacillus pectinivorans TaxID=1591408 RepID=UPI000C264382|nr:hypothetical protein [Sporolactobacillus pectinivorans]